MEGYDLMEWLGADMSLKILLYLEDPSDIIRVSAVSRSWHRFVIENGMCKRLCMKMFPEMSTGDCSIDIGSMIEPVDILPNTCEEWIRLKREHGVYASLAYGLGSLVREDCVSEAIRASSTDHYPEESIQNTLVPGDRVGQRASYWSSKGESDPTVPETLTYTLSSKICVITEIHINPFQAFFQFGFPLYSAKAVRFLMGHPRVGNEAESGEDGHPAAHDSSPDNFVWTYVSPDFPMAKENQLQKFKLPVPAMCIGGILQVQLLGRVQKQEMDGLYYICISHVQVLGRTLSSAFDVEILDQTGKCALRYCPERHCSSSNECPGGEPSRPRHRTLGGYMLGWEHMILNTLLGEAAVFDDTDSDSEYID